MSLTGFDLDPLVGGLPRGAQAYLVGGAVRDALLGRPCADRDWVVTGASAQDMSQAGFRAVGVDFPVFLHPKTQEEYALARTERKSGHGYKGFHFYADPTVSLDEDLARRDFTINAMAIAADGTLIDPYGGNQDLKNRFFRHVSPAFSEDPLRVLRLARFLARLPDFQVHPDTLILCARMVQSGELSTLVPERIRAEFERGLKEPKPSLMFQLIQDLGAWAALLPNVNDAFMQLPQSQADCLDALSDAQSRWAFLLGVHASARSAQLVVQAWRLPNDLADFVGVVHRLFLLLSETQENLSVERLENFFTAVDVYRKPSRLHDALTLFSKLAGISTSSPVFEITKRFVQAQSNGQYKSALRDYLANNPSIDPASAVRLFKTKQIEALVGR